MERVIDYLAEEEKKEAKRKAQHARINKLLNTIDTTNIKPQPASLDFLGD